MEAVPLEEQTGGLSTGEGRPVGVGRTGGGDRPAGGDPVRGLGRTAGGVRVGGGGRPAGCDPVNGPRPWSCSAPPSCESSRRWGLDQILKLRTRGRTFPLTRWQRHENAFSSASQPCLVAEASRIPRCG